MSLNIAMWSGPRNISTAMMRAWENRADTQVWDEPLYAAYLLETGLEHPMRERILTSHEADWREVVKDCQRQRDERPVFYQKHMSHHLLSHYSHAWLYSLEHAFLIRDPASVLHSYNKKHQISSLDDIGITQQLEVFEMMQKHGKTPPIIDTDDFLNAPEAYLRALCEHWSIAFDEAMLNWPKGRRDSDGVWGEHWYDAVINSTGFKTSCHTPDDLDDELQPIYQQALPFYQALKNEAWVLEAV